MARKERTRQAILDAALRLCEDSSLVALSLRQVAKEVGIVPTGFYRHFESIEDLGRALVDDSFVSLRAMLRDVRRDDPSYRDIVDRSVAVLLEHVRRQHGHFLFIARERSAGPPSVRAAIRHEIEQCERDLASDLARLPGTDDVEPRGPAHRLPAHRHRDGRHRRGPRARRRRPRRRATGRRDRPHPAADDPHRLAELDLAAGPGRRGGLAYERIPTGLGSPLVDYSEYSKHDAVGLAALVRAGDVEPDELLTAARGAPEAVNGRINAIVRELEPPDGRRAQTQPFAGVPFLVKDLYQDIAGQVTSNGSRAYGSHRAVETSATVQRWLDAGLRVFGQTNTPEFGAKGITESRHLGPARNPWNTDHTPGGSSGGTAAAVAAGIVPCAGASDGGGSIRIPASACGLFGLKATRGLVPSGPAKGEPLAGSSTDGVISRSVRDSAAMLDVIAGPTPESPWLAAVAGPYADEVGRDPGQAAHRRQHRQPDHRPRPRGGDGRAATPPSCSRASATTSSSSTSSPSTPRCWPRSS